MTRKAPIRVLVVDDSATARMLLVRALESAGDIRVVGTASDGREAVELTRDLRPDLVTMDVRMPNLDGVRATEQIMANCPTPVVIISSSIAADVETSFDALHAGALEVLEKPGLTSEAFQTATARLVDTVRAMAEVKVVRRRGGGPAAVVAPKAGDRYHALAVGASTGGPQALESIFAKIAADFPAPILVVQHMTPGFVAGFARWLQEQSRLTIKLAEDDEPLLPGTVYLAPDGLHLRINERFRAVLSNDPPRGMFRPSVDELFLSMARVLGRRAVGLLLTGMGSDGAEGLLAMRKIGALTLAQDDASCVVAGMPSAARGRGAVEHEIDLARMNEVLTTIFPRLS